MTTTITPTPQPSSVPPRVQLLLTAAVSGYTPIPSLQRRPTGSTEDWEDVRVSLSSASSQTVYDYDADFGVSDDYLFTVNYVLNSYSTSWNEPFASGWQSNWVIDYGTWATTGAILTVKTPGSTFPMGQFRRSTAAGVDRVTFYRHPGGLTAGTKPYFSWMPAGDVFNPCTAQWAPTPGNPTPTLTIQVASTSVSILSPGDTVRFTLLDGGLGVLVEVLNSSSVVVWSNVFSTVFDNSTTPGTVYAGLPVNGTAPLPYTLADRILVENHNTGSTTETAIATTTLNPTTAWLYHPYEPGDKSIRVESLTSPACSGLFITGASATQMDRASFASILQPLGSTRAIAINNGPRRDASWTLELATKNAADYQNVLDLFADDVPIRFAYPPTMGQTSCDDAWLIPQGWYSPGDITETRDHPNWSSPLRRWSGPLTPVAAPAAPPV